MNSLKRAGFASSTIGGGNAYKRLGIRTTDIARNLFTPPQPGSTSSYTGGKIVRSEFFGFWGQLAISESPDARQFFEALLEQIREIDQRQQASGLTGAVVSINGIPSSSIYNTIAFMLCTPSIRLDTDKLGLAYGAYADPGRDALRSSDSTALKNLMRLVAIRTQTDQSDEENILAPLVLSVLQIVPKDIRYLDWIRQSTIDEIDLPPNEHGFIYNYLLTMLNERGYEVLQHLLKAIFDKAYSLPQQSKMSLPNAEQTFLTVFHLTRSFLQHGGTLPNSSDLLDRGIKTFRQFTLWHQPYGKLAERLVLMLKQEILNPGYTRRQLIYHESLVVDYSSQPIIVPGSSNNPNTTLYRHPKPVFYLYESNSNDNSLALLNILDPQPLQTQHCIRPQVTMVDQSAGQSPPAAILTQMFINAFEHIPIVQFKQDEIQAIQNLSLEKIMPLMKRFRDLEEKNLVQVQDGTFTLTDRDNDYILLKTDLLKVARQSPGPEMFKVPFNPEGPQQQAQLPIIEHIRVPVELKAKTSEHDGTSQPGYPAASMYDRLQSLLQSFSQDPSLKFDSTIIDGPKLREIRFVLVGNDRLLQHVVTAYHLLQSNIPQIFHGLDIKFYLCPFAKNNLSNYIAKKDLWYYRQIYTPFRSQYPYIVPFLGDTETDVKPNNENGLIGYPTLFFRDTIQQYLREAHYTFRTVVFKLEGRTEPHSIEPSDIIPFVQRIELGIIPAAEEFKIKPQSPCHNMKIEDILKDKNFIYSPPDLTIKYLKLDLSNQPKPEVIDDPMAYQSVILSHVPRRGDLGNIPDPSSKGLELHIIPAPKIEKSKLRKNTLFFDPRQHLAEMTITSLVPFKLLADGVLHGPYRSIRISLAQNKSNGQVSHFPIQTFFPI